MKEVDKVTKSDILEILKKYNFDRDKYIVISGAAMVLLEMKEETTDIDIAVSEDLKNYLLENYKCEFERINEFGKPCYIIDDIINFSITYYEDKKDFVEEVPIQTVESLLKLKQSLNRSKDQIDISFIKRKLKSK